MPRGQKKTRNIDLEISEIESKISDYETRIKELKGQITDLKRDKERKDLLDLQKFISDSGITIQDIIKSIQKHEK